MKTYPSTFTAICAQRRAEAMQAARDFPNEQDIFVRLAWDWHRMLMRNLAILAETAPRAAGNGGIA